MEEWRQVPGLPIEASSLGRIRNPLTGRVLSATLNVHGYRSVTQRSGDRRRSFRCARLVCAAFHGPPPTPAHHADHINRDRADDRPENLRWLEPAENRRLRQHPQGERHWNSKLSAEDVARIRSSTEDTKTLAARHGVAVRTVRHARRGDTWKHLSSQQGSPAGQQPAGAC